MAAHIAWSSIELLHNVIRTLNYLATLNNTALPKVTYKAKVKLHGTNCAVQIHPEGVFCQSRTGMLTPEDDLKGFAKWVKVNEGYFRTLTPGITVFGEWCGPGVEKGMAVSALPEKVFAVFAIQVGFGADAKVVSDPLEITAMLKTGAPTNLFVLPWQGETLTVDFADRASLEATATEVNRRVEAVEKEDPWVKSTFGIKGLGEGLVLYPVVVEGGQVPTDPENLAHLMWKAKGEKHRTAGTKEAVQVDASVVANTTEFVALMVTKARLEQGLATVCGGTKDMKFTGKFIAWVVADVKKESEAELAASGLTWAQVEKAVSARAREWFLAR
jgi:hypothetical protein